MRIGIDARMYSTEFTGIGRYVYELTQNLARIDTKNEYVLFMNQKEFDEYVPPNKRWSKILVNARHYSLAEQVRYWAILRSQNLDLMHFTHFNAPMLYRRPSVVTIHDLTLSFYPGKKMNSAFYRAAYRQVLGRAVKNSTKIISVSENTKKDLVDELGVEPQKVQVIYEGVSEIFTPRPDKEAIAETARKYQVAKPFFLYTGVWRSHKNLINLLRAFKILRENENLALDAQLVITGEEDPYYPEVKRTVRELELEHDVIFTGLVPEDELVALYQDASVFVFPSLYEGFGFPPLEAMRCGTPVAASKSSCIPEVCGEGNALLFDPYDPQDIASTLHRLWLDTNLQKELRERGLRHSRKFSFEKMAEEHLALYQSLV